MLRLDRRTFGDLFETATFQSAIASTVFYNEDYKRRELAENKIIDLSKNLVLNEEPSDVGCDDGNAAFADNFALYLNDYIKLETDHLSGFESHIDKMSSYDSLELANNMILMDFGTDNTRPPKLQEPRAQVEPNICIIEPGEFDALGGDESYMVFFAAAVAGGKKRRFMSAKDQLVQEVKLLSLSVKYENFIDYRSCLCSI